MCQSPGRHSRTPGRKEEEGQCAKKGCSEPSMVPKALIFCMCLTGCLSSQGTREGRAQPAVAGGSAGEEEVERGGGQPAPRRTRHRRARQAPPAGVRGVVLISCGGSGSRNPPRPSRAARPSPCPGHRPTPSPGRRLPCSVSAESARCSGRRADVRTRLCWGVPTPVLSGVIPIVQMAIGELESAGALPRRLRSAGPLLRSLPTPSDPSR